jgi:hypothetical protein
LGAAAFVVLGAAFFGAFTFLAWGAAACLSLNAFLAANVLERTPRFGAFAQGSSEEACTASRFDFGICSRLLMTNHTRNTFDLHKSQAWRVDASFCWGSVTPY